MKVQNCPSVSTIYLDVVFCVCSVEATTEPPTPSCPANEVHDTCGTACPETCDGTPFVCTEQCVVGCRCASGFVKHAGSCIARESCPGSLLIL